MRAWSIIVALETCLCPKSYLLRTQVQCGQIHRHMRWVGGNAAGDLPRRSLVYGPRRVSPDAGTKDGGTGVVVRVRNLW